MDNKDATTYNFENIDTLVEAVLGEDFLFYGDLENKIEELINARQCRIYNDLNKLYSKYCKYPITNSYTVEKIKRSEVKYSILKYLFYDKYKLHEECVEVYTTCRAQQDYGIGMLIADIPNRNLSILKKYKLCKIHEPHIYITTGDGYVDKLLDALYGVKLVDVNIFDSIMQYWKLGFINTIRHKRE